MSRKCVKCGSKAKRAILITEDKIYLLLWIPPEIEQEAQYYCHDCFEKEHLTVKIMGKLMSKGSFKYLKVDNKNKLSELQENELGMNEGLDYDL